MLEGRVDVVEMEVMLNGEYAADRFDVAFVLHGLWPHMPFSLDDIEVTEEEDLPPTVLAPVPGPVWDEAVSSRHYGLTEPVGTGDGGEAICSVYFEVPA